MTPMTKLMWFARHEPTCAAVRWWVGLKDYALWRLTGTLGRPRPRTGRPGQA